MSYTHAMLRVAFGLVACSLILAQSPRELFQARCAVCHGPTGEGSRGPALKAPVFQRANDLDSLVNLLRNGIPGTEMSAISSSVVADEHLRALAAFVLAMRANNTAGAGDRLGRGAALFRSKGKCLDCHRVNGEGRPSGPDLSDIGQRRDVQWLRRAVAEPEADVFDSFGSYRWTIPLPDNYLQIDVTTRSGEHFRGSRLNEDAFSIQIRDEEGRIRSFFKREVAELRKLWGTSPMPSYKQVFSAGELEDIVSYLASLRGIR